jgi:predicted transcriptional regulator
MMGRLESTLMEILWSAGKSNVSEVMARLDRPLAYTTIMTTLDRLYKKGLLQRWKVERAFVYAPKFTRSEWERKRAGDFLTAFLAQPEPSGDLLISCLVDVVGEQDAALLDELERKIRRKRRELDRGRRTS